MLTTCNSRSTITICLLTLTLALGSRRSAMAQDNSAERRTPNFVVIFADDLGYGDLGCFGHPTIATPNLDQMATEGMKFTQFYSAAPVCTPSRAAILTGRLPARSGMCSNRRRVLFPNSKGGLQDSEITLAETLRTKGYATACIGKWHLGHLPQYLPMRHGFDSYFGIPYSNDMRPSPLLKNEEKVEQPADQTTITKRYTQAAVEFITKNQDRPFFLYFPHTFPHIPLYASPEFKDKSARGIYGDVVEELDASVGTILKTIRKLQLDNTLVIFTSDNGPWLTQKLRGGSAGLLREGKGSTWEGGMREPTVAWWPDRVKPRSVSQQVASTMDIFATLNTLAGIDLPSDRELDSFDLSPVLLGEGSSDRKLLFYYRGYRLMAVRKGPWKLHFMTQAAYGQREPEVHDSPLLFHLEHDPSERFNVAARHADVITDILSDVTEHRSRMQAAPSQLEIQ